MSTFGGTVREYERISIDRFDGINIKSTAFFLSHCHRDHMHGLSSTAFKARLRARPDAKLYVSEVSRRLLLNEPKYGWLKRHTIGLPLDCPNTVTVPTNGDGPDYELVVTLISAEHCAGSVMFLLEGECGSVLYTGDFRLAVGDTENLAALHEPSGAIKKMRCAYVDTTLCTPEAAYVPSRQDSVTALITLSKPTILAGGFLRLALPGAQLGYEGLFKALSAHFRMRVHVTKSQMSRYVGLTDVQETLTTDGGSTRIHAGCGCELGLLCVTVKPSAMWFAHRVGPSGLVEKIGKDCYRLCYSTHASLAEVRDLVKHLQPETVRANVRVPGLDVLNLIWPEKMTGQVADQATEQAMIWTMKQTVEKMTDQSLDEMGKEAMIARPKWSVDQVADQITKQMIYPTSDQRVEHIGVGFHATKQTMEQRTDQAVMQQTTELKADATMRNIVKDETVNQAAELMWNFWGSESEEEDADICLLDSLSAGLHSQKAVHQRTGTPVDQVKKQGTKHASDSIVLLPRDHMAKIVVDQVVHQEACRTVEQPVEEMDDPGTKLVWNFWGSDSSDDSESDLDCFVVASAVDPPTAQGCKYQY
ncbi:unnamed protein product [Ixodes hexagonus]